MRADALRLRDLLTWDDRGGPMHVAGERVLLMDASALGLLRTQLIDAFGFTVARGLLTRFGYAHGVANALAMREAVPWESPEQWKIAGGRFHRLKGIVSFEPVRAPSEGTGAFAEAIWPDSWEAEQHLAHHGQSDECVCWTLTGFASGYLSTVNERAITCIERSCRGRGDAVCRMEGRAIEDWGDEIRDVLPDYESAGFGDDLDRLRQQLKRTEAELRRARLRRDDITQNGEFVAASAALRNLLDLVDRLAPLDGAVLITGESGTGKELIARRLHARSTRAGGPFVAINCASLPESLLESELFGYVRGAFTGAATDRAGLFEAAHEGTILLDEIGEMPLAMQARLLRVLQEKTVRRVGDVRNRDVNVRIVAATHRDLAAMVAAGTFREDLYYRLEVFPLHVPALRERPEDIPALAEHFARLAAERHQRIVPQIAADALRALMDAPWPGNVRELRNVMERAVLLGEGRTLHACDLRMGPLAEAPVAAPPAREEDLPSLEAVEKAHILRVLRAHDGNRTRAAAALGIGAATLHRRLRAWKEM